MIRAFVALPLPDDVRARLAVTQQMLPLSSRVAPEMFHVTLAFLGEQPEPVLEDLHAALESISAPRLELEIAGLGTFGGAEPKLVHAAVVPSPALERLQERVRRAAMEAGIALKARRFVPHVTLSRSRPRGAELVRLEHALVDLAGLRVGPFEVAEMALYRSTLRPGGAVYDVLASYPLGTG